MKYDVVVIGAGSAGNVLATRLSEDPDCSVLLLEAGPDYPVFEQIPDEIKYGFNTGAAPSSRGPLPLPSEPSGGIQLPSGIANTTGNTPPRQLPWHHRCQYQGGRSPVVPVPSILRRSTGEFQMISTVGRHWEMTFGASSSFYPTSGRSKPMSISRATTMEPTVPFLSTMPTASSCIAHRRLSTAPAAH